MGSALSAPVELIRVQRHGSKSYKAGAAEMQGWRNGHEDAHDARCGAEAGSFWVLDGHGGDGVALEGAPKLGQEFAQALAKGGLPTNGKIDETLTDVDKKLREYVTENPEKDSGSTVVGALCVTETDGTYTVKLINCGDSRGIIIRGPKEKESSAKPVQLKVPQHLVDLQSDPSAVKNEYAAHNCTWPLIQESVDHKPSHPTERNRIESAGGHVTDDDPPRLDGNLAVSRGFGDFEYKSSSTLPAGDQKVSCIPDIYDIAGLQQGTILVLCCDGVWDVLTGREVGTFVRDRLAEDPEADLGELASQIIKMSLERDSRDNITAMVVHFVDGGEWAENHPPDEIQGFQKLDGEDKEIDEEVRKQYLAMLKKWNFSTTPIPCAVCSKWYATMMQCPCKQATYCSKECQKKGWKSHKPSCPLAKK